MNIVSQPISWILPPGRFVSLPTDSEGKEEKVFVIHRAPLGTHERTIGF